MTGRLLAALCVLVAACGSGSPTTAPPPGTDPPTTVATTTTSTTSTTTTTTAPAVDWGAVAAGWQVSLRRVGPYAIGMTIDEAEDTGGPPLIELDGQDPSCSYFAPDPATGLDRELQLMVRAGKIVRIDVIGTSLKTLSGVGIGDTAAAVTSTYGNAVIVSPSHTGNLADSYITYIPFDESDADYRLRFETSDGVVTTYRIGRLPEVEWVDRCR